MSRPSGARAFRGLAEPHEADLRLVGAEAEVIGHQAGKGKYAGVLGALRVRTANGVEFMLGTGFNEDERRNPPPIGSMVTYRYREVTKRGVPRLASFHRVRDI